MKKPAKKKAAKKKAAQVMPTMDKKWQAECDARTLAEAERIKADKQRASKAKKAAVSMANDAAKEAKALKKISGKK
jgi:hypothetical protein